MELLAIKLEEKREDPQRIQVLVPLRHLSLNPNVCGLHRCLSVMSFDPAQMFLTHFGRIADVKRCAADLHNASRFWFHFAICPSTRTSAVFAVVAGLDTVTKSFLFLKKRYFLILGTSTARRTKQKIKNYRSIKELRFINKYEPVTSMRCSDSSRDSPACDFESAI